MHNCKVKSLKRIAPDTILLTLQPKRPKDWFQFSPGQYVAIGFKYHGRPSPMRCFSIVSSPNNKVELQLAMRLAGEFTNSIAELEAGEAVFVYGPFGNFVIDEQLDRNVILIAGGIGITPFMSMIRYASEARLQLPITLLYSNKHQTNIPFYKELLELEQQNSHFKAVFFITNGGIDKLNDELSIPGQISDDKLNQLINHRYNRFTYFICGPRGFTKNIKTMLAKHNTDPTRIITEEFTPTSQTNSLSTAPKLSISRMTYYLTGASLALAIGLIMMVDLARAVPKLISVESKQQSTTSQTTSSISDQKQNSTTTQNNTASSSSNSNSNSSSTTQTKNYQPPITSVS